MTRHMSRPGLSRRGLLKGASALGASSLLLPFGMAAALAQPRSGGLLRLGIGHGSPTDNYDPAGWDQDFSAIFAATRHGYLIEIGPDGQLVGEIAESWATIDAMTWAFTIRQGVRFHSGKTLTVDDVIASLNHHRGAGSTSAVKPLVDDITDLQADGRTLVITLNQPNVDFPFILSDYHLPVLPATDGRIDVTSADGCGAYQVVQFDPGNAARLTRNPHYWKTGRAHFEGIEIITIYDAAARTEALQAGVVDVIGGVDPGDVASLNAAPGVKVLTGPGTRRLQFAMDSRSAPFDDTNLRLALKYAIDRDALVARVLQGHGVIGNDHPIDHTSRYFNTGLAQKSYDPDRSRYHLRQAGWDRLDLTLTVANAAFDRAAQTATLFADTAAAAGIALTVKTVPDVGYWSDSWMKQPFFASYWGGRPTENWMLATAYAGAAPWNESRWDHPRFNALLRAARSELDDSIRRDMYWDMQAICSDQAASLTPMFASDIIAHHDRINHNDTVGASWTMDGLRIAERWWFG